MTNKSLKQIIETTKEVEQNSVQAAKDVLEIDSPNHIKLLLLKKLIYSHEQAIVRLRSFDFTSEKDDI